MVALDSKFPSESYDLLETSVKASNTKKQLAVQFSKWKKQLIKFKIHRRKWRLVIAGIKNILEHRSEDKTKHNSSHTLRMILYFTINLNHIQLFVPKISNTTFYLTPDEKKSSHVHEKEYCIFKAVG